MESALSKYRSLHAPHLDVEKYYKDDEMSNIDEVEKLINHQVSDPFFRPMPKKGKK
jgi:hypothetical protein